MAWERVRRTRRGTYRLRIPPTERQVLRALPGQLRAALEAGDPFTHRLSPPAHPDDPEASERFRELTGDQLLAERLGALHTMEATLDASELDEEQMTAWLTTLNDLRLTLGTALDVDEEVDLAAIPDDHPDAHRLAVYGYLGWLVAQIVDAMSEGLPSDADG